MSECERCTAAYLGSEVPKCSCASMEHARSAAQRKAKKGEAPPHRSGSSKVRRLQMPQNHALVQHGMCAHTSLVPSSTQNRSDRWACTILPLSHGKKRKSAQEFIRQHNDKRSWREDDGMITLQRLLPFGPRQKACRDELVDTRCMHGWASSVDGTLLANSPTQRQHA